MSINSEKKIYNSRLLNVYLRLLAEQYPHVPVSSVLEHAGIEYYEIIDESSWFTQKQVDLFVEKCIQLTNNRNIAREAGRLAASPGAIGTMRQYTLGLVSPLRAFQILNRASKQFTLSSEYESQKIAHNKVEVIVRPLKGIQEKPYQCQNRLGFWEAITSGFNRGLPIIEHPECLFDGGNCCRYIISWKRSLSSQLSIVRNLFFLLTALLLIFGVFLSAGQYLPHLFATSLVGGLVFALITEITKRQETTRSLDSLWENNERLTEVMTSSAKNIQMVHQIGDVLTSKRSIEDVLTAVMTIMENNLDFDCGAVLLANKETTRLEIRGAFGYSFSEVNGFVNTSFGLDKMDSQGPLVQCFHQQKSILINSANKIKGKLSKKSQVFIDGLGIDSFICCPITVKGVSLGVIAVNNQKSQRALIKSDITLLQGIAPVIGVALQNAELIENIQNVFEKTIKVLADSIDARDSLTSGHSQQVTHYAEMIGKEMGFSEDEIVTLRIASLLHDYGKIGVPDTVLCKNGPLTTQERAIINTHPAQTEKILNQIPFPNHQARIPMIAGSHHERWDGTGYPRGLKGTEIPLESRIIAVADFFEAITAKRHYRRPMPLDIAIQLLKEESGTHFDPIIVDCFLHIIEYDETLLSSLKSLSNADDTRKVNDNRPLRVPFQTQVSVQHGRKILHGRTADISEKGIFVVSDDDVDYHASIIVTLCPPGQSDFVHIHGEIAWINNDKYKVSPNHQIGFAIRFKEVSEEVLESIRIYVKRHSGVTIIEHRKAR